MKKFILSAIICMVLASGSKAQLLGKGSSIVDLSWEIAFPVNNKYLSNTSFSGGRLEYRYMIKPQVSAGLAMSWNSFDQYVSTKTYSSADGTKAITSDMVRQIFSMPITAVFHYYPASKNAKLQPSIGIGLGTMYAQQNTYLNIYELTSENWGFVARPEAGLLYSFNSGFFGHLSASYQWASNQNQDLKLNSISQFAINLGVAWKVR